MIDKQEEQKQIEYKYTTKSLKTQVNMSESERAAYRLAWKHAAEYFNEIVEMNNRHVISQMSDAQFNEFMRSQMDLD